jgi:hypothetical protein
MEHKPANPVLTVRTIAIMAVCAVGGVLLGALLSNVVTASIPWVPIGAGLGAMTGVILATRQAPTQSQ